jgi:hypothetical protein
VPWHAAQYGHRFGIASLACTSIHLSCIAFYDGVGYDRAGGLLREVQRFCVDLQRGKDALIAWITSPLLYRYYSQAWRNGSGDSFSMSQVLCSFSGSDGAKHVDEKIDGLIVINASGYILTVNEVRDPQASMRA